MSKFIDRLNELRRSSPAPIGFGKVTPASRKPRIALIASMAPVNTEGLTDEANGADGVLLSFVRLAQGQNPSDIARVLGDTPWGAWLKSGDAEKIEELIKSGCDFVVFSGEGVSLSLLRYKELGRILEVGASLDVSLIRAINQIPVDGVFFCGDEASSSLTWHDLMLFRRFADLLSKPFLVPVPKEISEEELLTLWEAGVDGVVVSALEAAVKDLRERIDKLLFPRGRPSERREAILPTIGGGVVKEDEEEEEEEEE